jgi:cytochrome oxidase Cu insertion factor (SCO1/SenC/PrrC family)
MRASFVALAFAAALAAQAAPAPGIGKEAPFFTLTDQHGKSVTLSATRGHKVVLVFYRGYW